MVAPPHAPPVERRQRVVIPSTLGFILLPAGDHRFLQQSGALGAAVGQVDKQDALHRLREQPATVARDTYKA